MDLCLRSNIVLITGGSRGIGRAIATRFAEEGATVLITYASAATQADDLIQGLRGRGFSAHAYKADVKDGAAMEELVQVIDKEFGGIDILVNNAGIIRDGLVMQMDSADWDEVLGTNLTGAFNAIKPVAKVMMRARKGSIVNISSIAASRPGRGHCNYAASKGGVEAMTKALAVELASRKIRVNCVAPGMIETDMSKTVREQAGDEVMARILMKRFGNPNDIADAVMFLASDRCSYITGEVLHVDGGIGA